MARRALIAGLGLIGGSIGIALRRAGWRVAYLDPYVDDPKDAADERVTSFEDADLTILATPVDVAVGLFGELFGGLKAAAPPSRDAVWSGGLQPAVITTVCSVMSPFHGERVIAGHPLAGKEQIGLAAADGDLFRGRTWFVDRENALVDELIAGCGAHREVVDPAEHDAAVALTSHLPQLLSTALAACVAEEDLRFAGTGLKTFLRLAESEASVWRPILDANRDNIAQRLDAVMEVVKRVLEGDDEAFARARRVAARLSSAPR
jgi:prephenate dehydrogenase